MTKGAETITMAVMLAVILLLSAASTGLQSVAAQSQEPATMPPPVTVKT